MPYQQLAPSINSDTVAGGTGRTYNPTFVGDYNFNQQQQDQRGLAQQGALTREGFQNQYNMARLPIDAQMSRFNSVFPYYQQLLGHLGNGFGTYSVGGQSAGAPHISAGPIYSQQQTQQQINQQRAQTDQQAATQNATMQRQLAGQGYGAGSPLAALLGATNLGQAQASNANMAQNLRFGSAQANSGQLLQSQTAQSTQWNQAQNQDIERRKVYTSALTGLLGGLGNFV